MTNLLSIGAEIYNIFAMDQVKHPGLKVVHQWLNYQSAQGVFPGFQASIRKDGQIIYSNAFGYANLEKKIKYTRAHLGRIASQSKVFTAALVLWLESQNRMSLNEYLVNIITELKTHKDKNFKKIKLIDLLVHRSGILRDSIDRDYWGVKKPFLTDSELIDDVLAHPLVYRPGCCTKYSNIGYALLGLAIERITGEPLNILVEQFTLKINLDAKIFTDYSKSINLSQGYLLNQTQGLSFKPTAHRAAKALASAAGYCASTDGTTDFFHRLYLTKSILPKKQFSNLRSKSWGVQNVKSDAYGMGTIFSEVGDIQYLGHAGGFTGFSSQTWVVPKTSYAFGFMTNVGISKTFNVVRGMAEIIHAIDSHFDWKRSEPLIVSRPMADNNGSAIYVVGKSKVLAFPLTGFLPTEDLMVFNRHKDYFCSDEISGYKNIGEPLRIKFKSGQIVAVKFGGFNSKPVK